MSTKKYWVAFNIVKYIGPAAFRALLEHFGDLRAAWEAPEADLRAVKLDPRARTYLHKMRPTLDPDYAMEKVEKAGAHVLTWEDETYPDILRNLDYAPPVLYVKGALIPSDQWALAVVGARKATGYGRAVTQQIIGTLAQSGLTIVSGMAKGIDGAAHRAALEAGGRTIAVMGCGIDVVYPSDHHALAQEIIGGGAIISEYPIGTQPEAKNFPPRNRIISGLSLGVLVVEAGERSGSTITAGYASEQGRDVFAVPGPILASSSKGTNQLIQDGAKLVMCAEDILEELNLGIALQQAEAREAIPTNDIEAQLLGLLADEPLHIDEICRQSKLPIAKVSGDLTLMELKGIVIQVGSMTYTLAQASKPVQNRLLETGARYVVD